MKIILAFLLLPLHLVTSQDAEESKLKFGTPHDRVAALTSNDFTKAIQDPANPFWLLKFYAPWCGHCKKMAPVLEKTAPQVAGKMAIGKIDCTNEKRLCDAHQVKGYPTLKFAYDGDVYDYPGGRSEEEFIAFAEKMNRPALTDAASLTAADEYAQSTDEGVIFLAYHPQVPNADGATTVEAPIFGKVLSQSARKLKATGHFLVLSPSAEDLNQITSDPEQPFICRLEASVEPRCFDKLDDINSIDLVDFFKKESTPTVTTLGPHNFGKMSRKGRPLAIGVYDGGDAEQVKNVKKEVTNAALNGPEKIRNKYYYCIMDGIRFQSFLAQFNVKPNEIPQVFVLDGPTKQYWQNATYNMNVGGFLEDIESGVLAKASAGKQGIELAIQRLYFLIMEYRPWSVVLVALVVLALAISIASCVAPASEESKEEYSRKLKAASTPKGKEEKEASKEKTTTKESKKED